MDALDELVEIARLLGGVQARKAAGNYSREDAIIERALYELLAKHEAAIRQQLTPATKPCRVRA